MNDEDLNRLARSYLFEAAYEISLGGGVLMFSKGDPSEVASRPVSLGCPEVYEEGVPDHDDGSVRIVRYKRETIQSGTVSVFFYLEEGYYDKG